MAQPKLRHSELSQQLHQQQEKLDRELLESFVGKDLVVDKKRNREDEDLTEDRSESSSDSESDSDSEEGGRDWLDAAKQRLKVIKKMRKQGDDDDDETGSPPPIPTGDIFVDHERQRKWAERQQEKVKMKRFLKFAAGNSSAQPDKTTKKDSKAKKEEKKKRKKKKDKDKKQKKSKKGKKEKEKKHKKQKKEKK